MHIIHLTQNAGITAALNTGLQWIIANSDASYIARLDAGDICHPDRFTIQVKAMEAQSSALLCGTWCKFLSKQNNFSYLYKTPLNKEGIKKAMYFRNIFIHPTVMFRKDVVTSIGVYPDEYPHTEDYAYFWAIMNAGGVFIIPKILVTCEMNERGISLSNRKAQIKARQEVIRKFGVNPYRKLLGIIKLYLLLIIPNSVILRLKRLY